MAVDVPSVAVVLAFRSGTQRINPNPSPTENTSRRFAAANYHWSIHPLSAHDSADLVLSERIAAIHARSRQTYGAPRVHAELRVCGERHNRKRIAGLMRHAGIAGRVPRRYRRTTVGDPSTCCPTWCNASSRPSGPMSSGSPTSPMCVAFCSWSST